MSHLSRFLRLPARQRQLLIEASLYLGAARIRVALLPFHRLTPQLGSHHAAAPAPPMALTSEQTLLARDIAWAMGAAARQLPLKTVCLHQAIAAKRMLRHHAIPATLYLGARKEEDQHFHAHAWVRSGDLTVIGGSADDYTVVASFT